MYSDPENIREHVVKIRMNEREYALVKALNDYTGQQLAVIAREILLDHASHVLGGFGDISQTQLFSEVPQHALSGH